MVWRGGRRNCSLYHRTIAAAGLSRMPDEVRERMRLGGVEAVVGSTNFYERVTDGVRAWQGQERVEAVSPGRC